MNLSQILHLPDINLGLNQFKVRITYVYICFHSFSLINNVLLFCGGAAGRIRSVEKSTLSGFEPATFRLIT
jgi:hypothetical protein